LSDDNIAIVQPYCECSRTSCLLRDRDPALGDVCAIQLPLSHQLWLDLLRKHNGLDGSVYVTSVKCEQGPEPGDELLEEFDTYRVYRATCPA
jgi:hypothetical protein